MAKHDKQKEIWAKKGGGKRDAALVPVRPLSPLHAWDREIDRMFEDFPLFRWPRFRPFEPFGLARGLGVRVPTLDMYEEKDELIVKAEMPGLTKDDIEITLGESTLTLKGEKRKSEEIKEKDYYRCEREYGSFVRTVELPAEVRTEDVKAVFKDGVLEIRLPKTEEAKRKVVRVPVE